jgi:hypoxanthine-DNA glycosylase
MTKRCFDPVTDPGTRVLILGSLPGDKSLALQQYYGHPQNKFWELLGAVLGSDLRALDYEARLAALRSHGVGLWDVIAEAQREGSLDTALRNASHNSLAALLDGLPSLKAIAFNGGTAARHGRRQVAELAEKRLIALIDLPSSSPAHTIGFERKLAVWRQLAAYFRT